MAKLVLNKCSDNELWDMPSAFRWSGLIDCSTISPVPVCPAVVNIIYRALRTRATEALTLLARLPHTRDTAFELFVTFGLRHTISTVLSVPCTDLVGRDRGCLQWLVNKIIVQDADTCWSEIEDGTLVICRSSVTHSLVDMVLYRSSAIYFIQISMLPYDRHANKIQNLMTCKMENIGEDITVGQFYVSKAPVAWNLPALTNKTLTAKDVIEKVQFVYCTLDRTQHHSCMQDTFSKHVLRVGSSALKAFGLDDRLFIPADGQL
jgi:hypothetical protein